MLLTIVNSVYLPLLSKETNLIYRTKELNFYLILIGFIIASPFIFVPEYLITVIYGEKFLIAADIYKIFGLIIFLRIIGSSYGILLSVSKKQIYRAIALVISITLMFLLDIYLLPISDNKLLVAANVLLFAHILITLIYIFISYRRYKTLFIPSFNFILQKIISTK